MVDFEFYTNEYGGGYSQAQIEPLLKQAEYYILSCVREAENENDIYNVKIAVCIKAEELCRGEENSGSLRLGDFSVSGSSGEKCSENTAMMFLESKGLLFRGGIL